MMGTNLRVCVAKLDKRLCPEHCVESWDGPKCDVYVCVGIALVGS